LTSQGETPRTPTGKHRSGAADLPAVINGRYQVKGLIGKGGQGYVCLAYDPNLDIDVAVKVLHSEFRDEEFMERFMREARITAAITHQNIVRVYELNKDYPYLVMEYCGDGDLSLYIKSRRRRSLTELLGLGRQICEALVPVHEHDPPILHRDLKPGNVLFKKGVLKVADFGLGKMLGGGSGLTMSRGMMGTVRYCSPEQLRDASKADERADLWSVGVVLYELLTWCRPFDKSGDSSINVMRRVDQEPFRPPPYEVPGPVMEVVSRALEKDPAKRFRSAREMIAAIDKAVRAVPGADELLLPPEDAVRELDRLAARTADLVAEGELREASTLIKQIRQSAPDDSLGRFWDRRIKSALQDEVSGSESPADSAEREEESWLRKQIDSIQTHIQAQSHSEAIRLIAEILVKRPGDRTALGLLEQVNASEKRAQEDLELARREAGSARASGDIPRVVEIWKQAQDRHPGIQEIQDELAVATRQLAAHRQQAARESAERAAREKENAGDLAAAIEAWRHYAAQYPEDKDAARRTEALIGRQLETERSARLAATRADAGRLAGAGNLHAALDLWEAFLRDDPGATEASQEADGLRNRILAARRARELDAARLAEEAAIAAGDYRGAVDVWNDFIRSFPGDEEGRARLDLLTRKIAEQERMEVAQAAESLAGNLEERIRKRRYDGVPEARDRLLSAIREARAALSGDGEALRPVIDRLHAAAREAEQLLGRVLALSRSRLKALIEENRHWLTSSGGSATEEEMARALGIALAALCEARPPEWAGDPLGPLADAEALVSGAAETLSGERRQAIDAAGKEAEARLAEAGRALEEFAAQSGGDGTGSDALVPLRARLADLTAEAESRVPERLVSVAREAAGLASRVESMRIAMVFEATAALRRHLIEARGLALWIEDEALDAVTNELARFIEGASADEPLAPGAILSLEARARAAIDTARTAVKKRRAGIEAKWAAATKKWNEQAGAGSGSEAATGAAGVLEAGESARAAGHLAELEECASRLEGLAKRIGLESAWMRHNDAVLRVEGALDEAGPQRGRADAAQRDLVARYRKAAARGDVVELQSIGDTLAKSRSRRGAGDEAAGAGGAIELPEISGATRRLNERYNAPILQRCDSLAARCKESASKKRGDAVQLAKELQRAHGKLLQPAPIWRRMALPGAAAAVAAILAAWFLFGAGATAGSFSVRVMSPAGSARVETVLHDGAPVARLAGSIPEGGATWDDLAAGVYEVTLQGGLKTRFTVPDQEGVLLPSGQSEYQSVLLEALELQELIQKP